MSETGAVGEISPTKRERSDSDQEKKRIKNREKQRRHKLKKERELVDLKNENQELKAQNNALQRKFELLEASQEKCEIEFDDMLMDAHLKWVNAIAPLEASCASTFTLGANPFQVKYGIWKHSQDFPILYVISCGELLPCLENTMELLWSVYTDSFLADTVGHEYGVLNQTVKHYSYFHRQVNVIYCAGRGHATKPTVMRVRHIKRYQHPVNLMLNGTFVTNADIYIQTIENDGPSVVKNTYIFHHGKFWILRCFIGHKDYMQGHYPFFPFVTERGDFSMENLMGKNGLFAVENVGVFQMFQKKQGMKNGTGVIMNN